MKLFESLNLEIFEDGRGKLSALEFSKLPFVVRRLYVISEVPDMEFRGGHAHKKLNQAFICLSGSAELILENGLLYESVTLQAGCEVIMIGPYIWRELHNFAFGTQILVLADKPYSEEDYIRDKQEFLIEVGGNYSK